MGKRKITKKPSPKKPSPKKPSPKKPSPKKTPMKKVSSKKTPLKILFKKTPSTKRPSPKKKRYEEAESIGSQKGSDCMLQSTKLVESPTIFKVVEEEEIHMENEGDYVEEEVMNIENDVHDDKVVEEEEMNTEDDVHDDKVVEEAEMNTENDVHDEGLELGDGMHTYSAGDANTVLEPTKKKKSDKVRGRSVMKGLGLKFKKAKKVRFNQFDQPIGKNSVKLSSFLGVLVRRNLSLNYNDWRKVKQEVKDNLWAAVKQRFAIDDYYKAFYVGKMGCLLKEARSRTAGLVLAAFLLEEEERNQKLADAKPDNMSSREWETFIDYVRSPTFKSKRIMMQEVREHHHTPHTISRKGYARLEEELKKERNIPIEDQIDKVELWKVAHKQREGKKQNLGVEHALQRLYTLEEEGTPSGSSLKEDLLSKAIGEERPGRVRGMGYGVNRTKLSLQSKIQAQCNKTVKELKDYVEVLSNRLVLLEEKNSTTKNGSPSIRVGTPNSGNASNNLVGPSGGSTSGGSPCGGSPSGSSPSTRPGVVEVPKKGQHCKILSWYKEGEVVADGKIHEVDSQKQLHGLPIGIGAYSVWVNYPHVPDALLYKPTSECRRVKDAVGTIVAWHKDFISLV